VERAAGGHGCRAGDHESECEHAGADPHAAGADRLPKARILLRIADRLAATEVIAITSIARPICKLQSGRIEGEDERDQRGERPGLSEPNSGPCACVRYLIAT